MAFDNIPRPTDWLDFIGPREGRANGLQGAHLYADKQWGVGGRFNFLTRLGFGPNQTSNGSLNPETQRGGFARLSTYSEERKCVSAYELKTETQTITGPTRMATKNNSDYAHSALEVA